MKLKLFIQFLLTIAATFVVSVPAHSATGLTYHGRIIKPNGQGLEAASVFFHIQIRSPGSENCLLFDEQQTLNMTGSKGLFVLTIGDGTRAAPAVDGGNPIDRIFANKGTISGAPTLTCNIGTTYSPALADGRKLQVQFNDGSGWESLPPQSINYVPLAIESTQISGYKKDQLLRVADGVVATEFTAANWLALWDLITGNSSLYMKNDGSGFAPTAAVDFNGQQIVDLADPTLAQDAATKNYADTRLGGRTVDATGISNVAGDGKTLIWNQAAQKWEAGIPNDNTKLALSGGTMTGPIDMGSYSVTNVGHILVADQGTLYLGKFDNAQEATLLATPLNSTTHRGRTWFNTDLGKIRFWDGSAAQTVGEISSSDVTTALGYTPVNRAGDTMSGALAMGGNLVTDLGAPTASNDAVRKIYADSNLLGLTLAAPTAGEVGQSIRWNAAGTAWEYYTPFTASDLTNANIVSALGYTPQASLGYTPVNRAGDTMTGLLLLSGDPSNAVGAATKQYVDAVSTAASGAYVRIDGTSVLSANWDLNGGTASGTILLTGLAVPTASDGAATKGYVDSAITGAGTSANTYADGVAATAETNANAYTDSRETAIKTYADGKLVSKNLAVPAAAQDGQSVRWNETAGAWEYFTASTASGSVASVASANADIAVGGTATNPILTLNSGTAASQIVKLNASAELPAVSGANLTNLDASDLATGTVADARLSTNVALKSYVDAADLKLITKNLAQPVAADDMKVIRWNETAGAFEYAVDASTDSSKLPLAGGTMSGNIIMGGSLITGLGAPVSAGDAVNKTYADARETGAVATAKTYADGKLVSKDLAVPTVTEDQKGIKWDETAGTWVYYTINSGNGSALTDLNASNISSGTLADARLSTNVALKSYVDAADLKLITKNLAQPVAGDDMKVIRWNQTAGQFEYAVDSSTDASKLPLAGGTMSGAIAMGNNAITGLAAPSANADAVNKAYADGRLLGNTLAAPAAGQVGQAIRWNAGGTAWEYFTPNSGDGSALTNLNASNISSGTLADARLSSNVALVTGKLDQFAATSSAELAAKISDESGTGLLIYGTNPTLVTPTIRAFTLGGATSGGITMQVAATGATGTYTWPNAQPAGNRILQSDASGNLTWVSAGGGGDAFVANSLAQFASTTSLELATVLSNETGSGSAVFGTSPTITTPSIGTGFTVNGSTNGSVTFNAPVSGAAGTYTLPSAVPGSNMVLQSNASGVLSWVADANSGGTVTGVTSANTDISVGGTAAAPILTLNSGTAASQIVKLNASAELPAVSGVNLTNLDASDLASGTVPNARLSSQVPLTPTAPVAGDSGKSVRWNGTAWEFYTPTTGTGDAVTSGDLNQFAAGGTTSAELANQLSDESGTGLVVYNTNANLVTPTVRGFTLGGATSGGASISIAATGATGSYVWPSAAPGSNMVLQSNSSGVLSWVADSTSDSSKLPLAGGTMSGAIAMGSNAITGLAAPSAGGDAVNKTYADGNLLGNALATPVGQQGKSIRWNAGNTAWEYYTPSTGTVTGVTSANTDISVGGTAAAPVLTLNSGTGADQIVKLNASSELPAVSGVNLTALNASNLGSGTVPDARLSTNVALKSYVDAADLKLITKNLAQPVAGDDLKVIRWNQTAGQFEYAADSSTDSSKLPLAGGTMSGAIAMGTSKITGMGDPTAAQDAATKNYADLNLRGNALATPVGQAGKSIRWNAGNTAWEYYTPSTGDALTTGKLDQFAATSSAELAAKITDETGTGLLVYGTAPTLKSFTLGGATSGGITMQVAGAGASGTYTWPSALPGSSSLLQVDSSGNLTWVAAGGGGDAFVSGDLNQFAAGGTTSAELANQLSDETGTGLVVYGTSPTLVTPTVRGFTLGGATSGGASISIAATGATGSYTWPSAAPGSNMVLQSNASGVLSWVADANSGGTLTGVTSANTDIVVGGTATVPELTLNAGTGNNQIVKLNGSAQLPAVSGVNLTSLNASNLGSGTVPNARLSSQVALAPTAPVAGDAGKSVRLNAGGTAWEFYTPSTGTGDALTSGDLNQFAAGGTTSAELANQLSDETGTGLVVYGTSPTITTPSLGTGFTVNGSTNGSVTFNAPATGAAGTYTLPSAVPGSNMVLQSNASGVLSWVADSTTDASKLPLAGGTMTGAIAMGGSKITGLGTATAAGDAVDKTYADSNLRGNALATPVGQAGKAIRWNAGNTAWEYFTPGDLLANGSVALSSNWDVDGAGAGTRLITGLAVPSASDGAATKGYVDSEVSTASGLFLKKDGTVGLTADWDANGSGTAGGTIKITGLDAPTVGDGAATKAYADGRILGSALAAPVAGNALQSIRWNTAGNAWEYYTPTTTIADDSLNFDKFSDALSLDASTDIAVTGTNLLSITNTGTAASLRVNDVASDTTPFIIDADGKVGIGNSSPQGQLHVDAPAFTDSVRLTAVGNGGGSSVNFLNATINSGGFDNAHLRVGRGRSDYEAGVRSVTSGVAVSSTTPEWFAGLAHDYGVGGAYRYNITEYNGSTNPRLTILPGGNVGIGTASPNQILTVEGVTSLREVTAPTATANYGKIYVKTDGKLYFMDDAGVEIQLGAAGVAGIADDSLNFDKLSDTLSLDASTNIATGANVLSISNDGAGNSLVVNDNGTSDTSPFVIDGSGNVGIGTNTPGTRLNIVSAAGATDGISISNNNSVGSAFTAYLDNGDLWWYTGVDGTDSKYKIRSSGSSWATGADALVITPGNDIGIGAVTPAAKLDVKGTLGLSGATSGTMIFQVPTAVSGTYTWPAAAPASNMILQSSSTGQLSWVSANAGTVTSVTSANADISVGGTAAAPVLTLNSGTGADQIVKLNASSQLPAVSGVNLTNLNATNIASGTLAAARLPATVPVAPAAPLVGNVLQSVRWNSGNTAWEYFTPATTTNKISDFAAVTSAELSGKISDETGSGLAVFGTSPTIVTPTVRGMTLGGATSGGITMQVAATGATGTYTWPSATPSATSVLQSNNAGTLSWVIAPSATPALSALSAASAANTIDNLNFAQTWNWSTANTQTPMTINANAMTTGSVLSIASSNNSLNSTNGLLRVANTGTSTNGIVARIQSNSAASSGLTVHANGSVGVGNTAPSSAYALDVTGYMRTTNGVYTNGEVRSASNSGSVPYSPSTYPGIGSGFFAGNDNITDGSGVVVDLTARNSSGNHQTAVFGAASNTGAGAYSPTIFIHQKTGASSWAERFRIHPDGKVGISSSSPQDQLHVEGGSNNSFARFTTTSTGTTASDGLQVGADSGGSGFFWNMENQPLRFGTNNSESMRVAANGNVGIASTNPLEKLDVGGAVKIGNTTGANAGTIRWTGVNFQGYDGSSWFNILPNPPAAGACDTTQTFNTAGVHTYTVPATFATITIKVWGGGGAGGGIWGVSNNGSASSVASLGLSAGGGAAGQSVGTGSLGVGGVGGSASGGDTNTSGASGGTATSSLSGVGGNSPNGGTGGAGATAWSYGNAGSAPGGGGSGAYDSATTAAGGGGAGGYTVKVFTSATLPSGTSINDILVGAGGAQNTSYPAGGAGGSGQVSITCSTTGTVASVNDRGIQFLNSGVSTSSANLTYEAANRLNITTSGNDQGFVLKNGTTTIAELRNLWNHGRLYIGSNTGIGAVSLNSENPTAANYINTGSGLTIGNNAMAQAKLDVVDTGTTTSAIIVPRAGAFTGTTVNGMVRYNSTSNLFEFRQNGAWVNYTTVSDGRLKTNIVPVTGGLDIVNKLNPVFYDWDKNNHRTKSFGDRHEVGFIAQEVEQVLPEVVSKGEDSYRSVEYGKIVAVVVDAIKSLYNRILGIEEKQAEQDRAIAAVKEENQKLKEENAAIKAYLCSKDPAAPICK